MQIRTQSGGIMTPPVVVKGIDSVVISTDEGSPVAVAMAIEGAVWIKTINDPEFLNMMSALGFDKRKLPTVTTVGPQT